MIEFKSFFLKNIGIPSNISDECLYVIEYNSVTLYVGQSLGQHGYSIGCRLCRHFGIANNDCMRINERSGASAQFSTMVNKLPNDVKDNFTIRLLCVSDVLSYIDLQNQAMRLKMIGAGITAADIKANNLNKKTVNFCEKALAWSLCPIYCKAGYCDCTTQLPNELIKYLT